MPAPITTSVTICNSALLKLGSDGISSLTQNTRAAIVCNTLYNYLRDEVMGESPWRFATKRAYLTPVIPPWELTLPAGVTISRTYYQIPSDCLRPLSLSDNSMDWTVEGPYIVISGWGDSNDAILVKYIYRNTDESSWDARFCEMFAWRLCMELALALTQSVPMKQEAEKSYDKMLAQARAMNAVTGTIPPLVADIWSSARRGDYYWRRQQGQGTDGENYDP